MHPSFGVTKEYILTSEAPVTKRQLQAMLDGTEVDGAMVRPLRCEKIETPDGARRREHTHRHTPAHEHTHVHMFPTHSLLC